MRKPEMILFDYGHTLVFEPAFDYLAGCRAVLSCCVSNPLHITPEMLAERSGESFRRYQKLSQDNDLDMMDMCAMRLVYESLRLTFDRSLVALERVYWDAAGPAHPMPGVPEMLKALRQRNIRTGVVSNMNFREENLINRIDRLLPENEFDFILASCEYATRKPRKEYFDLALTKASLSPEQVWFVGDNPRCDIEGSANAGLFPVLYQSEEYCPYRAEHDKVEVGCNCLKITDWAELLEAIDGAE